MERTPWFLLLLFLSRCVSHDDIIKAKLIKKCKSGKRFDHCPKTVNWQRDEMWKAFCIQDSECIPRVPCKDLVRRAGKSDWDVCVDALPYDRSKCLVYSVGVANHYQFDTAMGAMGCEVHSFDPTVDHPTNLAPNVTFHKWYAYTLFQCCALNVPV
jgi:Methyltransferase domain